MRVEAEIDQIRHGLIDAFGRLVGIWGLNETYGRLFGLLYFSDEPLSLAEIAEELMVSKATVSVNIRVLEKLRAVQKIWQKGSRKDYYVVERDFQKILQEMLRTTAQDELQIHYQISAQALTAYEALLKGNVAETVKTQARADLAKLHEYVRWIQISERWVEFFLKTDMSENSAAEVRHITVEWEDE